MVRNAGGVDSDCRSFRCAAWPAAPAFHRAYHRGTQLEAHEHAFHFFGGVFKWCATTTSDWRSRSCAGSAGKKPSALLPSTRRGRRLLPHGAAGGQSPTKWIGMPGRSGASPRRQQCLRLEIQEHECDRLGNARTGGNRSVCVSLGSLRSRAAQTCGLATRRR